MEKYLAMNKPSDDSRILIVDDEEGIRFALGSMFKREGFQVFAAGDDISALKILKDEKVDVALFDIRLKGSDGVDLLKKALKLDPDLTAIMITGHGSIDSSVAAMKEGAADYILKPIDNISLLETVRKNLELKSLRFENSFLKSELLNNLDVREFLSGNSEVRKTVAIADKVKNSPASILISGESGTGKEVLARYIHFTSTRREANFIGVNCAALSESLLLSELFGHEKGSFTGALSQRLGKFELADGGTLFLDEIGDMPLDIQAKLLRVLEERSFERVGGVRQIHVDVRVIAATNQDLKKMISDGRFRKDLYFRLNVISCSLPPLRQRSDDIPLLTEYFIRHYNERYNKSIRGIRTELLEQLSRHSWPGNIRELQNLINQAVLLCEGDEITSFMGWDNFESRQSSEKTVERGDTGTDFSPGPLKEATEKVVSRFEETFIGEALKRNRNNRSRTAEELEVTRKTLARKIEKYGL